MRSQDKNKSCKYQRSDESLVQKGQMTMTGGKAKKKPRHRKTFHALGDPQQRTSKGMDSNGSAQSHGDGNSRNERENEATLSRTGPSTQTTFQDFFATLPKIKG